MRWFVLSTVVALTTAACDFARPECGDKPLVFFNECPICKPTFDVGACIRLGVGVCAAGEVGGDPSGDPSCPDCFVHCRPEPCAPDTQPVRESTGCPSCYVVQDRSTCAVPTERCTEGQVSVGSDGCKLCFPEEPKCTREADSLTTTAPCADVRECATAEFPRLDVETCCPTCKITNACTTASREACLDTLATLPVCVANITIEARFDRATCCVTCKPDLPPKVDVAKECTREQFQACKEKAQVCRPDERPLFSSEHCCATCVVAPRLCPIEVVANCDNVVSVCAETEKPTLVVDSQNSITGMSCCPTCKRPRPTCGADGCGDDEVCTHDGCKPKRRFRFLLKALTAKRKELIKNVLAKLDGEDIDREEARELIKGITKELVERFCQKADNQRRCEALKEKFLASVQVEVRRPKDGQADTVDVEVAEDGSTTDPAPTRTRGDPSRRLLESGGLVSDSVASEAGEEGFGSEETKDASSSASRTASMGIALALAGLVLAAMPGQAAE